MDDLLTQQKKIKKLEKQTKISNILAGSGLVLALVFGILWFTSSSKSLDQKPNNTIVKLDLDTIDYQSQTLEFDAKEETYLRTVDSLGTILLALEDTVTVLKDKIMLSSATSQDYIYQMIENAKIFTNTDCNKSLAFLYAAKKIASMEQRVGPNIDAIQTMIKKCEANVFGESPSASN